MRQPQTLPLKLVSLHFSPSRLPQLGTGYCYRLTLSPCFFVNSSVHSQHRATIKNGQPSGKQWKAVLFVLGANTTICFSLGQKVYFHFLSELISDQISKEWLFLAFNLFENISRNLLEKNECLTLLPSGSFWTIILQSLYQIFTAQLSELYQFDQCEYEECTVPQQLGKGPEKSYLGRHFCLSIINTMGHL